MGAKLAVAFAFLGSLPALAAEPSGCDKFKWPITSERAALNAPDRPKVASGAEINAPAVNLALLAPAAANLPASPERTPQDGTFAGFATLRTPPKPGTYTISLSKAAWIDVVQGGKILRPKAFSGATDCDGIRKTMKHELAAQPFVVQVTGSKDDTVSLAVLPSAD